MTEVIVNGGDIEKALRQFKKLCLPILKELRIRRAFESKPKKRRRKRIEAKRKTARLLKRRLQSK
jgi:ribosomal protein S21